MPGGTSIYIYLSPFLLPPSVFPFQRRRHALVRMLPDAQVVRGRERKRCAVIGGGVVRAAVVFGGGL